MPYDIIDNRTRELAPEINDFLADSIRAETANSIQTTLELMDQTDDAQALSRNSCALSVTTTWRTPTAPLRTGPWKHR